MALCYLFSLTILLNYRQLYLLDEETADVDTRNNSWPKKEENTGVKIDNLVQIAHNVIVGNNTCIAAQVGIAGSTTIGKDCLIGGQAGIAGHLKIGDRVQMQAKSGVLKNIDDDSVIMGYPAISYRDYNKSYVHFKNLPKIMNFINKLMKKSNEQ